MSVRCYICKKTVDSYYKVCRRDDDDGGTDYLCPDCFERECQNNNAHAQEKEEIERQITMVEKQIESAKRAHWMMWDEWERFNKAGDFVSTFCWDRPPAKPINYAEVEALCGKLHDLKKRYCQDDRKYYIDKKQKLYTDKPEDVEQRQIHPLRPCMYTPPIDNRLRLLVKLEHQKAVPKYEYWAYKKQKERKESLQRFLNGQGSASDIDRLINSLYTFSDTEMLEIAASAYSTDNILYEIINWVGFEDNNYKKAMIRSRVLENENITAVHLNGFVAKFVCWSDYASSVKNSQLNESYRILFKKCLDFIDGKIPLNNIPNDVKQFYLNHPKLFKGLRIETLISRYSDDVRLLNAVWGNNINKQIIRDALISNPSTPVELLFSIEEINRSNPSICQKIYETEQFKRWKKEYKTREVLSLVGNSFIGFIGYVLIIALIAGPIVAACFLLKSLF